MRLYSAESLITIIVGRPDITGYRLIDAACLAEGLHGLFQIGEGMRGCRTQKYCTQKHGFGRSGRDDRFAARICENLPGQIVLTGSTADDDLLYVGACFRLRFDDLSQTIADAAKTRDVERHKTIEISLHS